MTIWWNLLGGFFLGSITALLFQIGLLLQRPRVATPTTLALSLPEHVQQDIKVMYAGPFDTRDEYERAENLSFILRSELRRYNAIQRFSALDGPDWYIQALALHITYLQGQLLREGKPTADSDATAAVPPAAPDRHTPPMADVSA